MCVAQAPNRPKAAQGQGSLGATGDLRLLLEVQWTRGASGVQALESQMEEALLISLNTPCSLLHPCPAVPPSTQSTNVP